MDGDDGHLVFDFEGTLDTAGAGSASVVVGAASASDAHGPADSGNARQTVCRHWLRGLCMKGDSCGYLHQYDQDRMPVCYFYRAYGCCREQDCVFKHNVEDVKEGSMYNMGFCPNGPQCRYRHVKKPGPPPRPEEVIKQLRLMNSLNYGSSSGIYQPRDNNNNQQEKPQVQHGSVLKKQNLAANATPVVQEPIAHHVKTENQQHVPQPYIQPQQQQNAQGQDIPNGSSDQATITASPLPQGQSRYSVVKSCNWENLEESGNISSAGCLVLPKWSNAVILIFSTSRSRHFQVADVTSRFGGGVGNIKSSTARTSLQWHMDELLGE